MSESKNIRDDSGQIWENKGCLIDFDKLKEGDLLFSVSRGWCEVVELSNPEVFAYPICLTSKEEDFRFSVSEKGMEYSSQKIPVVFTENPYEYAINQIRKYQSVGISLTKQNQNLWEENMRLQTELDRLKEKLTALDV